MQPVLHMAAAFAAGFVLTFVQRRLSRGSALTRSMRHAQILLCVAGALVMSIIGDSLARAFGIAGAVAIVRFRTPVDDPKDAIVLFLSLGLGMAAGLGQLALAASGTLFVCLCLAVLDRLEAPDTRTMILALESHKEPFPANSVQKVFERNQIEYETRGMTLGQGAQARYLIRLAENLSLDSLSAEIHSSVEGGIRSVAWEKAKKANR